MYPVIRCSFSWLLWSWSVDAVTFPNSSTDRFGCQLLHIGYTHTRAGGNHTYELTGVVHTLESLLWATLIVSGRQLSPGSGLYQVPWQSVITIRLCFLV